MVDDVGACIDTAKGETLENGKWQTLSFRNMSLDGHPVSLSMSFESDRIRFIHLSCRSNATSWADYSPEKEAEVKTANDKLLKKLLHKKPPYRFSWGIVESSFDGKTGDAGIFIRYDVSLR